MSLRLLLDEDTQAKQLVLLLRNAGHDVQTVSEANLADQGDVNGWAFAGEFVVLNQWHFPPTTGIC